MRSLSELSQYFMLMAMILHTSLGNHTFTRSRQLKSLIAAGAVTMAGNRKLKIYGTLTCRSGKRMLPVNRIFFKDEAEAQQAGYRPCKHCMKHRYLNTTP